MNYRKLREYEITLMVAYGSKELQELHDPRLNPYCVSKNEYIARQRFLKNLNRPNRAKNVEYTMGCWLRHQRKKYLKKLLTNS